MYSTKRSARVHGVCSEGSERVSGELSQLLGLVHCMLIVLKNILWEYSVKHQIRSKHRFYEKFPPLFLTAG